MKGTMNDHDICLDDLLADAVTELKSQEMHSLARAVEIARERLDRAPEVHMNGNAHAQMNGGEHA